jgi:hypothetical protein
MLQRFQTFATRSLSRLKCVVILHHAEKLWSDPALNHPGLSFNGFAQFFESFAAFVAVDCFWWEKFTQQEAFTIPKECACMQEPFVS